MKKEKQTPFLKDLAEIIGWIVLMGIAMGIICAVAIGVMNGFMYLAKIIF